MGYVWQPSSTIAGASSAQGEILAFSPLQNGGCKLWLDATDYSRITFSGSNVAALADKSSFSNNAAQSGGTKPAWSQTSFNGLAAGITYGPSTTDLVVTAASSITDIYSGGGTISVSFVATGSGSNQTLFIKSPNAPNITTAGYKCLLYGSGNNVTLRFFAGCATQAGVWDTSTASVKLNTPYVLQISYVSSSPTVAPVISLNGVVQTLSVVQAPIGAYGTDSAANFILGNGADGGNEPFLGVISQTTMHNITQSAAFLARLMSFLGGLSAMTTVPLYILCGQSNMVGNATAQPTTVYKYSPANLALNNPLIWNGNIFDILATGKNNEALDANSIGPEISFGAEKSAIVGTSAYILKYAVGATSLAVDWAPTSGAQWIGMVAAINAALPFLANQGIIPVVQSFLWTQGETDAQTLAFANAYQTNLTNFIEAVSSTALASYTKSPDYTFVISGLPNQNIATIPYQAIVRQAQITVGAQAGNAYISTIDLSLNVDGVHFDAQSQITLGQRFATTSPSDFPIYVASYGKYSQMAGPSISYVVGPSSSTDSAVALWNGVTGKVLKNSGVTVDGSANITANSFKQSSSTASVLATTQSNSGYGALGADPVSFQNTNSGNSVFLQFYNQVQDSYIGQLASVGMAFGGTTESMRLIFANNALLINTTTDDGTNKLQVNGGITATAALIPDSGFKLKDDADATKTLQFQLSGLTTGTASVGTIPNLTTFTFATITNLTQTFAGQTTFSNGTVTVGSSTGSATYGLGTGATTNGTTKTINVGTAGVSGSITNVNIGSAVAGATGTLTINSLTISAAQAKTGLGTAATATSFLSLAAATTSTSSLNIAIGTAPTSPGNGDIWFDGTNLKIQIGGATKTFTVT